MAAALIIIGAGYTADRAIPHQHLPWRSLNPEAPSGFSTKMQLMRLSLSPSKSCMDMAVRAKSLSSVPADPKNGKDVCGWKVARVTYGTDTVALAPGEATMQCPLSIGTYIWARELDRLAKKHLGAGLTKIHHAGTYSCRRQRGNGSGTWSEHAFANAFDVTGFSLSDGRVISVQKDWKGEADRRRFLRSARSAACGIFRVTLSPDFNAAHYDHFHLDMGPSTSCR